MNFKIVEGIAFAVIANVGKFNPETAKEDIPKFWDEHFRSGKGDRVSGEYGICIDELDADGKFEYLIADLYDPTRGLPDGFEIRIFPQLDWIVFKCKGAIPEAIQNLTDEIFDKWFPSQLEYRLSSKCIIEKYDDPTKYPNGNKDENYVSEVWIPVKHI